jgi:type III secretion system low calcium response chaperone LcrH/SycD
VSQSLYVDFLDKAVQKLASETNFSSVRSWSVDEQKIIYTSAFTFYQQKSFEQAVHLFTQLCMANPFQEAFWRGLASSLQMLSKWKDALHAWCISALLADQDPMPHFHAAECFFSMNDREEASKAILQAEKRLDSLANSEMIKTKISLLKELLAER